MDSDKFRFKDGVAILQEHGNYFLQITLEFIERFALGMRPGKPRHKPDK